MHTHTASDQRHFLKSVFEEPSGEDCHYEKPQSPKLTPAKRKPAKFADQTVHQGRGGETHHIGEGTIPTLITQLGIPVADDQDSIKIGTRGPVALEDVHFRGKLFHFDHERIPERVVPTRGCGAHGYFENYALSADITIADQFEHGKEKTPAFVRLSTMAGNKGSAEFARDVRGFAVNLYTSEGKRRIFSGLR